MNNNYPPGMSNADYEYVNGVHLDDDIGNLSNCCTAIIYEDSDICSACKEHCVSIDEEEAE